MTQKTKVIQLYKTLLHLGKDYPQGYEYFRSRLKMAFLKNKTITDSKHIDELINRGNFVVKEIEALYMLKKYRAMKNRYYETK